MLAPPKRLVLAAALAMKRRVKSRAGWVVSATVGALLAATAIVALVTPLADVIGRVLSEVGGGEVAALFAREDDGSKAVRERLLAETIEVST